MASTQSASNDTASAMPAQQIKTTVLLTGGCGFIGSNVCENLLKRPDHRVVIVDNLSNQYSVEKVCCGSSANGIANGLN